MKGFMRMIEALLSLTILMFIFLQVLAALFAQESTVDVALVPYLISYLDTISRLDSTKEVLESFDFQQVDFLFSKLAERVPIKVELEYNLKNVGIYNPTNSTLYDQLVAFTYNFPENIDEDSIEVKGEEGGYSIDVRKVWFRVPIRIQSPSEMENINVSLDDVYLDTWGAGKINNQSIKFFVNDVQVKVEVRGYTKLNAEETRAKVNITFNAPRLEAGLNKCYLYFSTNESISTVFPENYYELQETPIQNLTFQIGAPERSYTFDILVKIPRIDAFERKELTLGFKVGTSEQRRFEKFNLGDLSNSNLVVNLLENSLKGGGRYIATRMYGGKAYVFERTLGIKYGLVKVRLYGWSR